MTFDKALAERIRHRLAHDKKSEERKMFGCIAFMVGGHAAVGVWKRSLIVRVGPDAYPDAILKPNVREFDITGKPMKGWVVVGPAGVEDDQQLAEWVQQAIKFVGTLPTRRPQL